MMPKFHPYMPVDLTEAIGHNFSMRIRLTGLRWWMFKSQVALFLMKVAGRLLGVPAEISLEKRTREEL